MKCKECNNRATTKYFHFVVCEIIAIDLCDECCDIYDRMQKV